MSNCADCGVSFSEIKNDLVLQGRATDISKWDEHLYYWISDAVRRIGDFSNLHQVNNYKISLNPKSTKIPLPDSLFTLNDVCFGNRSDMYTGTGSAFNKNCGCVNSDACNCVKWYTSGCYIYTSSPIDEVTISFSEVPMDEDGLPYVSYRAKDAVIAYIKLMMLEGGFDDGKIPQRVYETRYRQWLAKRREARSKAPQTEAEMRRLANIYNSKLPVSYRANTYANRSLSVISVI